MQENQTEPTPPTPPTETGFYNDEQPFAPATAAPDSVSWTASEYIAHHKSARWYAMLGLVAFGIALLVWFATRDVISAVVVLAGAGVLGGYGARQPRELQYQLDLNSLSIGAKVYSLDAFRSFTVDDQQAIANVNLLPLKRFAPGLSIYFATEDEDAIIDILALRLPIEEHQPDPIDRLMRHIRF